MIDEEVMRLLSSAAALLYAPYKGKEGIVDDNRWLIITASIYLFEQ